MAKITNNDALKVTLATGLQINGDSDVAILEFLQSTRYIEGLNQNLIARIAVSRKFLKEIIGMLQECLRRMEKLSDDEETQ